MKKILNQTKSSHLLLKFDLKMKLSALLIFVAFFTAQANTYSQKTTISLHLNKVSLEQLIDEIESKTEFKFIYKIKDVAPERIVSVQAENEQVSTILDHIFANTEIDYTVIGKQIFLTKTDSDASTEAGTNNEEERQITGKVTDKEGKALPGATVLIKGTLKGITTDAEGNYTIMVPNSQTVLVFSYVGFASQEIIVGKQTMVNVTLKQAASQLEDVVVIGYGTLDKAKVTGSISKVTAKEIENLPVASLDQALQGQAAGVHIVSSGAPGGATLVRIRGQSSINAGNEPLYVIDGTPVISGILESGNDQFGRFNTLSGINPQDIASMEILKDAAATAIYGSRGANGVILITTKKGRQGKTNINLNVFHGFGTPANTLDVLNSEEYLMIKKEAYINDGLPIPDDLANADASINTNWQDEIFRTSSISQYQLSMDGGNEKTTFYLSGNYRNEESILLNNGLKRGSFRLNLDHWVSNKLKVGTKISLSHGSNKSFTQAGGLGSPIESAIIANPTLPVKDEDGEYTVPLKLYGFFPVNPVAELLEPKLDIATTKVIGSLYMNYKLSPDLNFRVDAGYDFHSHQRNNHLPVTTLLGSFNNGWSGYNNTEVHSYTVEPQLKYEKNINIMHNFQVVMGATFSERITKTANIFAGNFIDDDLIYIISAGKIFPPPGTRTHRLEYAYNSFFARVNYDYQNRYLFSASLRRDGSSRFGKENQYGTFWALAGGWAFSEEDFLKDSKFLTFGKIRMSYGITGNDQISDFANLSKWAINPGIDGNPGLVPTQVGNPELRWEQTAKFDVGLELNFWNDRIGLEIDYFIHRTSDLLFNKPLAEMTGHASVTTNIGETENKGVEFSLNTVNIKSKDFSWTTQLNIGTVKNKIISLVDDNPIMLVGSSGYFVGQPINIFYTLDFQGVDPETGNAVYRDVDGDGVIDRNKDRTVIGNALPDFYGGMTNTFSWKNLSLDIFIQFANNQRLYDASAHQYFTGGLDKNNQIPDILNRWQKPGDITDVPKVTTPVGIGMNVYPSQRYIQDASYLRLKNITLSYNLPTSLIKKWGISKARLYITGTNLFTFTKFKGLDPEGIAEGQLLSSVYGNRKLSVGSGVIRASIPQTKMFILGLNLTF